MLVAGGACLTFRTLISQCSREEESLLTGTLQVKESKALCIDYCKTNHEESLAEQLLSCYFCIRDLNTPFKSFPGMEGTDFLKDISAADFICLWDYLWFLIWILRKENAGSCMLVKCMSLHHEAKHPTANQGILWSSFSRYSIPRGSCRPFQVLLWGVTNPPRGININLTEET